MYALVSFHLDCTLVECLAHAINVCITRFRQSYREISIVYGLTAKAAFHDALHLHTSLTNKCPWKKSHKHFSKYFCL